MTEGKAPQKPSDWLDKQSHFYIIEKKLYRINKRDISGQLFQWWWLDLLKQMILFCCIELYKNHYDEQFEFELYKNHFK